MKVRPFRRVTVASIVLLAALSMTGVASAVSSGTPTKSSFPLTSAYTDGVLINGTGSNNLHVRWKKRFSVAPDPQPGCKGCPTLSLPGGSTLNNATIWVQLPAGAAPMILEPGVPSSVSGATIGFPPDISGLVVTPPGSSIGFPSSSSGGGISIDPGTDGLTVTPAGSGPLDLSFNFEDLSSMTSAQASPTIARFIKDIKKTTLATATRDLPAGTAANLSVQAACAYPTLRCKIIFVER